jgi:hypothetical protein
MYGPSKTVKTLTEWGQISAPDGQWRVFTVEVVWISPKTLQNTIQTDWNLISSNLSKCSGFCSGFDGDSTHFQTTNKNRFNRRIIPKLLI